jgi:hypothetical protein
VRRFWLAALGFVCLACSDSGGPSSGSVTLSIHSGDQQVGLQHTELPQPLLLEARDRSGRPVAGARVSLYAGPGSGQVLDADTITDALGQLRFRWELGETWANTVHVSFPEYSGATISATAQARYLYETPAPVDNGWQARLPYRDLISENNTPVDCSSTPFLMAYP